MMKTRLWIFALLVVAALGAHLALLSPRVAHVAEESLNVRRAVATTGLRAQMDLIDARLAPRVLATTQELVDLMKAPTDVTQPMPKPDERALRAALTASTGEPDLLIVANPQGAAVQRKGKGPAQMLPGAQVGQLPLARAILEGGRPKPGFAMVDDRLFRVAGSATPANTGAVVVGILIDDALASRLRTTLDADVTFFDGGRIAATSVVPAGRPALQEWIKHPSPGYGLLDIRLPLVNSRFNGRLPLWADKQAFRAALVSLDSGVQAAVSIPAALQLAWLGRYQGLYLAALLGLLLFALVWGLIPAAPQAAPPQEAEPAPPAPALPLESERHADKAVVAPLTEVPWAPEPHDEPAGWDHLGQSRTPEGVAPVPEAGADAEAPAFGEPLETPAAALEDHVPTEPKLHKHNIELFDLTSVAEAQAAALAAQKAEAAQPAREEAAAPADELARTAGSPTAAAADAPPAEKLAPAQEFSFAGLLDEAHEAAAAAPASPPPAAATAAEKPAPIPFGEEQRETTNPGVPSAELLAAMSDGESFREFAARQDEASEYFPGDEPTRIEPVSAALLDKLREIDDETQTPRTVEHAPEKAAEAAAALAAPPPEPAAQEPEAALDALEPQPSAVAEEQAEPSHHPGDENTDEFAKHALEAAPEPVEAHAAEEWPEQTAPQTVPSWHELEQQAAPEEPQAAEPEHAEPEHAEPEHAEPPAQPMEAAAPPALQNGAPPEAHVGDITLTNLQLPRPTPLATPVLGADPDETHWRETFQRFLQTRAQTGEPSDKLSYDKFAAKLKKNREDLLAKHGCRGVRFQVYVKEGKAAIKASAIK